MLRNVCTVAGICLAVVVIPFLASPALAGDKPISIPYSGCGTLQLGPECLWFMGDDGTSFDMPLLVDFTAGDYVNVSGDICIGCASICQSTDFFLLETVTACGEYVDQCGTLAFRGFLPDICIVFEANNGNVYSFENIEGFGVGDFVRITGLTSDSACPPFNCGQLDGCITKNSIQACGETIDECGTIVPGGSLPFFCLNFMADSGHFYAIENSGAFGIGSRVRITGITTAPCPTTCGPIEGCIIRNSVIGCADINQSGIVDVDDLLALINAWGPCPFQCAEDLNIDGQINVDDLLAMLVQWD